MEKKAERAQKEEEKRGKTVVRTRIHPVREPRPGKRGIAAKGGRPLKVLKKNPSRIILPLHTHSSKRGEGKP